MPTKPRPNHRRADPGQAQELRQLRAVPERVRRVADELGGAEPLRHGQPALQVAHEQFAVLDHLVLEHVERPGADPAGGDQLPEHRLALRADGEVVLQDDALAVEEEEAVPGHGAHALDGAVDHRDELVAEAFERPVPLAVPVRRGDPEDALYGRSHAPTVIPGDDPG